MTDDPSNGWDAIAEAFIEARSDIGADVICRWARGLPPGGAVLDIGCGAGLPVSGALIDQGFDVFGIDASPALVAEFRRLFPSAKVACEAAETSRLFDRMFDGAVAIGLLFLLPAKAQREIIARIANVLRPQGRFLFSAPRQPCTWTDIMTGRESLSRGEQEYGRILQGVGLVPADQYVDEGENHYFSAVRPAF